MSKNLISVTVYLDNGTHYVTSMNAQSTDAEISAYFVGRQIDRGRNEKEEFFTCVSVTIDRS